MADAGALVLLRPGASAPPPLGSWFGAAIAPRRFPAAREHQANRRRRCVEDAAGRAAQRIARKLLQERVATAGTTACTKTDAIIALGKL
jgi:hypothetical protein